MKYKIGEIYTGIGYCGMTDGKIVKGKLIEFDSKTNSAIIHDEKTSLYCSVIYRTLKPFK